jgi:hypothetical protein
MSTRDMSGPSINPSISGRLLDIVNELLSYGVPDAGKMSVPGLCKQIMTDRSYGGIESYVHSKVIKQIVWTFSSTNTLELNDRQTSYHYHANHTQLLQVCHGLAHIFLDGIGTIEMTPESGHLVIGAGHKHRIIYLQTTDLIEYSYIDQLQPDWLDQNVSIDDIVRLPESEYQSDINKTYSKKLTHARN